MLKKAATEYEKYRAARANDLSDGERDFIKHLEGAEKKLKPIAAKGKADT